jgi:conjugative relaxase-like TrwC/TraI family protein
VTGHPFVLYTTPRVPLNVGNEDRRVHGRGRDCQREVPVTVRVTTLKGPDAGAYYVEKLPNYYLDAEGEPPGMWLGRGADLLGLEGELDDVAFLNVMAGAHPEDGERLLGRPYDDRSVRGFDVTASAPKSVSVLFAIGDDATRTAVLTAHDAAVAAMVGWIEAHAHTRYRIEGEVAVVDAEGIVAAAFRQHTSRALDPQLHTHVVVANRVRSDDCRWLALDARTLKLDQRTLSALYHAGLRSELTRRLGVAWREPENGIAEIAGVPDQVLALFSARTDDITRRLNDKLDRFEATFEREPTPRERWRLEREAVLDSRPTKAEALDAGELHAHWSDQLQALGDPERLVWMVTRAQDGVELDEGREDLAVDRALSALVERQSTWRHAEVVRELAAALPTSLAIEPDQLIARIDHLADELVATEMVDISRPTPEGVRVRRDGRPVTESAADRALTTPEILAQEERLLEWAERRVAAGGEDDRDVVRDVGRELAPAQVETAAAVAGTRDLVLVVGPAGTGKTAALRPGIDQLRADGRAVFGVAPSAAAAEVLATETGVPADTLDKLLVEHSLARRPDRRYNLPPGATVLVDEAGMVSTPTLAELAALADAKRWRVVLVGDPLQFSAVGRAGMFGHLGDTCGAIELDRVHRFANDWERDASLRLRRGDLSVVDEYDDHGRIHGLRADRAEHAVTKAWAQHRANGETVAVLAPGNDTVVRLNQLAQQRRITAGELEPMGRSVVAGQYQLRVGDEIVTRHNDRTLRTDRDEMVRNRARWTIQAITPGGDLVAQGPSGTIRLPHQYVVDHVELGYAQTSHAAQGRTADRSLLLLDGPTDARGIYVPMTRGRHSNDVYVVTDEDRPATDVVSEALSRDWIDTPATVRRAELQDLRLPAATEHARPVPLSGPEVLALLEQVHDLTNRITTHDTGVRTLPGRLEKAQASRTRTLADLTRASEQRNGAREALAALDRPLVRRLHRKAVDQARSTLQSSNHTVPALEARISEVDREIADLRAKTAALDAARPRRHDWTAELADTQDLLARDLDTRARHARLDQDPVLVDRLGPRPAHGSAARLWDTAAARIDQHSAAYNEIGDDLIGHGLTWLDSTRYTNRLAVIQAVTDLDNAVGRQRRLEREPLDRSLGP